MKISYISIVLISLFCACSPYQVNVKDNQFKVMVDNAGYITFLSIKYWQGLNQWPTSMETLKSFAKENDSLGILSDSLSSDFRVDFNPVANDSVKVEISNKSEKDSFIWFWITPNSVHQTRSSEIKRNKIEFVDDTLSIKK